MPVKKLKKISNNKTGKVFKENRVIMILEDLNDELQEIKKELKVLKESKPNKKLFFALEKRVSRLDQQLTQIIVFTKTPR
ncbi:hypothetical protein COT68_01520 [bacterium (Candidatus Torokbacteria) CG09_land_8_20_14_0_10_42_11]|nr:MAG: hypothetical protein COT68_01520 [bacterium (Candidatus Torokbacteria) CG09_land_8_20_14_0_10_42_11]